MFLSTSDNFSSYPSKCNRWFKPSLRVVIPAQNSSLMSNNSSGTFKWYIKRESIVPFDVSVPHKRFIVSFISTSISRFASILFCIICFSTYNAFSWSISLLYSSCSFKLKVDIFVIASIWAFNFSIDFFISWDFPTRFNSLWCNRALSLDEIILLYATSIVLVTCSISFRLDQ